MAASFGHGGAQTGQLFASREEIRAAGLHRHKQRGISGLPVEGAEAIVLSGGYADDIDLGNEVIYTGEGGRDPSTRQQVEDQALTGGNAALVTSHLDGFPIRVFRGHGLNSTFAPKSGYRYDGLYYVDSYWPDRPPTHGFLVWRFRLLRASDDGSTVQPLPQGPPGAPPRVPTTVQRIVRSTAVAQDVKNLHKDRCQVCGQTIELPDGRRYAEAAHVRPLGLPHSGPDVSENVLCLCPADHIRFDNGAIYIDASGQVINALTGAILGPLRSAPGHQVDPAQLAYHRERWSSV